MSVTKQVEYCLANFPKTRDDDILLYDLVVSMTPWITHEEYCTFMKVLKKVPRESIVVRRRAYLHQIWLYPASIDVQKKRHKKELKMREEYWLFSKLKRFLWK